jgi:hypothetical protein
MDVRIPLELWLDNQCEKTLISIHIKAGIISELLSD